MAKSRTKQEKITKPAEAKGTPVCIAALYCTAAVVGEDKTVTIIRTMDTIGFPPGTQFKLGEPVELAGESRLVIMLKRNNATGRHQMPIIYTGPNGETDLVGVVVEDFSEDAGVEAGYNSISPIRFVWRGEGLYWLEMQSEKKEIIARTALRLKIASPESKK